MSHGFYVEKGINRTGFTVLNQSVSGRAWERTCVKLEYSQSIWWSKPMFNGWSVYGKPFIHLSLKASTWVYIWMGSHLSPLYSLSVNECNLLYIIGPGVDVCMPDRSNHQYLFIYWPVYVLWKPVKHARYQDVWLAEYIYHQKLYDLRLLPLLLFLGKYW